MGNRVIVKEIQAFTDALIGLRETVHAVRGDKSVQLRGGVFKELAKAQILTLNFDNWEVGYRRMDRRIVQKVEVFVKVKGYTFDEVPDSQKDQYMRSIISVFFSTDSEMPKVFTINPSTVRLTQTTVPWEYAGKGEVLR